MRFCCTYLSQICGSSKLRMSPIKCRLPVHKTNTRFAVFRQFGMWLIDIFIAPFVSLLSRPLEIKNRLSVIELKVRVGIGNVSASVLSTELDCNCCRCDANKSSQVLQLSPHRLSCESSVTFKSIRSEITRYGFVEKPMHNTCSDRKIYSHTVTL